MLESIRLINVDACGKSRRALMMYEAPILGFFPTTISAFFRPSQTNSAMAEWTADANDALNIQLVRSVGNSEQQDEDESQVFNPAFTYPVRALKLVNPVQSTHIREFRYTARTRSCMVTRTF